MKEAYRLHGKLETHVLHILVRFPNSTFNVPKKSRGTGQLSHVHFLLSSSSDFECNVQLAFLDVVVPCTCHVSVQKQRLSKYLHAGWTTHLQRVLH